MIEPLESRTFCSTTPHAALIALRSDVAGIVHQISHMIAVNQSAISNLNHDVSLFPDTSALADNNALRQLNFQFTSQAAKLQSDFIEIKFLFAQDITQLINKCNAYNRNPTNAIGLVVQASQQLLTSQGTAAVTTVDNDSNQMQAGYLQALALVSKLHPLDSTLVARTSHISEVFTTNIQLLKSTANTVAVIDIPNFITALEPNGVITSTTA